MAAISEAEDILTTAKLTIIVARKNAFFAYLRHAVHASEWGPLTGRGTVDEGAIRVAEAIGSLPWRLFVTPTESVQKELSGSTRLEDLDRERIWDELGASLRPE